MPSRRPSPATPPTSSSSSSAVARLPHLDAVALDKQPTKGIFFTAISIPAALGIWLLVHDLFGLDSGAGSLVITVCFSFFWQIAWSFGGRPANLVAENRWLRGSHEEVADRIAEYHDLGIDEFIFSGYPHLEEAYQVGEGLIPVLRGRGWTSGGRSLRKPASGLRDEDSGNVTQT